MRATPLQVLILSTFTGGNANVIRDYLFSFHAYSKHACFYIFDCRTIARSFDFRRFDVIVVFWSVYLPGDLAPAVMDAIAGAPAVKVLFLQDEYRDVRLFNRLMARLDVRHMFTCVEPPQHELFYPRPMIPGLEACHTVLTGYVPEYLARRSCEPFRGRTLDIGYRSRALPPYLGDLAREKVVVAERFAAIGREHGFSTDISVDEADRIYGRAWVRFVRSSRFALGTPSGASVVDFSGDIRRRCDAYLAAHPEAGYQELRARFFADVDGKVVIDTISPRIFEAIALGNVLVLHEGRYGGILDPRRHYIEVRRDYSNMAEVVERMRDREHCRRLALAAYEDLIASGRYSYRRLVERFDAIIEEAVPVPLRCALVRRPSFYAGRYLRHGQYVLPRGAGCLRLPTPRRIRDALLRATERAPVLRHLRVVLEPRHSGTKALVAVWSCLTVGPLRRACAGMLQSREGRRALGVERMLDDALRLAVLLRLGRVDRTAGEEFAVCLDVDEVAGSLTLVSQPVGQLIGGASEGELCRLELLMRQGRFGTLVWDHSGVGESAPLRGRGRRGVRVHVGPGGVYRFEALGWMLRHAPARGVELLRLLQRGAEGTAGGPMPLRWRGERRDASPASLTGVVADPAGG